jgi:hypothetical protein
MSRTRIALVAAVLFGLAMGGGAFAQSRNALSAILIATIAGAMFGVAFAFLFARRMQTSAGSFDVKMPEGHNFTFQVPAAYRRTPAISVGGVLFFGPGDVVFAPHSVNLPGDRHLVVVPVNATTTVTITAQTLTAFQRLLIPNPSQIVRITTGDETYDFVVPNADDAAEQLRKALW